MRVYAVGAPESFYQLKSDWMLKNIVTGATIIPRMFSQEELKANLKSLPAIVLFISIDEAYDYARTLRVCRASHLPDPSRKQIAPVIHLDLSAEQVNKYLNSPVKSETINYTVYEGAHYNFASKDNNGAELTKSARINYRLIASKDFNLGDFNFICVDQPDSGNPMQLLNAAVINTDTNKSKCTLL